MKRTLPQYRMGGVGIRFALVCILLLGMAASGLGLIRQRALPWWNRSVEEQVGHYRIRTDLPADEANAIARHLNIMYAEYARRLANLPQRLPEKLQVYIFQNRLDYQRTLRDRFGVDATGSGGMFFVGQKGYGLAFYTEDLPRRRIEHVIQHEGFHQFAYSRFAGGLPPWVNEGLAEFFGESVVIGRTLILGQGQERVIDALKEAVKKEATIPFQDMLTMTGQRWNSALTGGNASLQYNQAWSMVHFLVYGEKGKYRKAFEGYLRRLNRDMDSEQAFIDAFHTSDLSYFERKWKQYAHDAKPGAFLTALERIEFLAEGAYALQQKGIAPASSLDELRIALREINFTSTIVRHGMRVILKAEDDAMFVIPQDDLSADAPFFALTPHQLKRASGREQYREKMNPTPPTIRTEHLKPKRLWVEWQRSKKGDDFRYRIRIK